MSHVQQDKFITDILIKKKWGSPQNTDKQKTKTNMRGLRKRHPGILGPEDITVHTREETANVACKWINGDVALIEKVLAETNFWQRWSQIWHTSVCEDSSWRFHAAVPKATFFFAMAGQGWRMEWRRVGRGGIAPKPYDAMGRRDPPGFGIYTLNNRGKCNLGDWRLSVGTWVDHGHQCYFEREQVILEAPDYEIDVPCPLQWGLLW